MIHRASNFHISQNPADRIVHVLFYGVVGLAERLEAAAKLVAKFGHRAPLRVLVDLRFSRSDLPPAEQREFGRFLAEHPILGRARLAVLHSFNNCASPIVISEARALGHDLRPFFIEAEAKAWLKG
ncbi:hypothetical protein [Microbulbifer hainanensis]|uniref:hypothetical protein n=1 Tax=Microbulbifer hainanensis TaxID=2735675 RepID=UPI001868DB90|nr:hypothetical protein [Microbulbifer hainanensis]